MEDFGTHQGLDQEATGLAVPARRAPEDPIEPCVYWRSAWLRIGLVQPLEVGAFFVLSLYATVIVGAVVASFRVRDVA